MSFSVKLEDNLTAAEINGLFTVDGRQVKTPKAKKPSRGFRKAKQSCDYLASGVSVHAPGTKQRLTDLDAFYSLAMSMGEDAPSPFDC